MKKSLVILLAVILIPSCLCLTVGGIGYTMVNSFRKGIVDQETQLSGTYKQCEDSLSARIEAFKEGLNIANVKSDKVDQIVKDFVTGRLDPAAGKNDLFTAVTEANGPDLSKVLDIYDTVLQQVSTARAAFHGCQQGLIDQIAAFRRKIHDDIIGQAAAGLFHLPDENLIAANGSETFTGDEALTKMAELVVTSDTTGSYDSGHLDLSATTQPPASKR